MSAKDKRKEKELMILYKRMKKAQQDTTSAESLKGFDKSNPGAMWGDIKGVPPNLKKKKKKKKKTEYKKNPDHSMRY